MGDCNNESCNKETTGGSMDSSLNRNENTNNSSVTPELQTRENTASPLSEETPCPKSPPSLGKASQPVKAPGSEKERLKNAIDLARHPNGVVTQLTKNTVGGTNTQRGTQISSHASGSKMEREHGKVERLVSGRKKSDAPPKTEGALMDSSWPYNPSNPYYCLKLDSVTKLKDSTKKLLNLIEEIQNKTISNDLRLAEILPEQLTEEVKQVHDTKMDVPSSNESAVGPVSDVPENKTTASDPIYSENEEDDCSIYKRLTRKCNCLNQVEYNDFVIHFNEDTKYCTSTIGEIIKNLRILKKFLYIGGRYTQNALLFLNEGYQHSSYREKVQITQGCAHADICNVFEDQSLVAYCLSQYEHCEDSTIMMTQNLAAAFLHTLAQLEEGRRYLKFTSKISNDIRKILRKGKSRLDMETLDALNATLNLMLPPMKQRINVAHYCKPIDEGYAKETLNLLMQYRKKMTLDDVFTHLDLLQDVSSEEQSQNMLYDFLPGLFVLFKNMATEYDSIEMNEMISNIIQNIVNAKQKSKNVIETSTEPIPMRTEITQMPSVSKSVKYLQTQGKSEHKSKRKVKNSKRQHKRKDPTSL